MVITKIDWSDKDKFSPEKWIWLECLCDFNIPVGHINWFNDKHEKVWECEEGHVVNIKILINKLKCACGDFIKANYSLARHSHLSLSK
jgi:hypothetical protein